jgi:uncharacterized membrane protein
MMMGFGGMSLGLMVAFGIARLLLFVLFVYIIVRIVKHKKANNNPAMEALRLKFVNGEIAEEEFLSKAAVLKNEKRK